MYEEKMIGEEIKKLTKEEINCSIREGVKSVIEQVLEEEMESYREFCVKVAKHFSHFTIPLQSHKSR